MQKINTKNMKNFNLILFITIALITSSCTKEARFTIQGTVTDAAKETLYLEVAGLEGDIPLDSIKLKEDGHFSFKAKKPEAPEFYRLRIKNKIINFAVDSTEVLSVNASLDRFSDQYEIEGSTNAQKIKELSLLQSNLQIEVNELMKKAKNFTITHDVLEDSINQLIKDYKDTVKLNYIYSAPNTTAAYFALFQKLNGYLIFDPLNSKDDVRCFAAVATSMNNYYPHADRSKNIYNIVIKGMRNTRTPKEKVIEIPEDKINETGLIDVNLRNMKGNRVKLSEQKGKVVLLDFTIYQSPNSTPHNYMLRDLYNQFSSQGFEIYQVSLDADEHYWKTIADNLPWICVRDENGVYSTAASLYNVTEIPSFFIINRQNELYKKGTDIKDLATEIKKIL